METTGEEACLLAIFRQHVRLGENLEKPLNFQRFNGCSQIQVRSEEKEVESISQCCRDRSVVLQRRECRRRELLRSQGSNILARARAEDIQAQLGAETAVYTGKLHL
jgi:hypothetical protein